MTILRASTRGSPLARWQAEHVAGLLAAAHPGMEIELIEVETMGDVVRDRPIHELGGQGVFVKEVQAAVLDGRCDFAVHSAKDLPSITAPGLVLASIPQRGDVRDALVGRSLDQLGPGATVATGSVRRRAQLAHLRPDLAFVELRGNMHTRIGKVPDGGAVVAAVAALVRLGLDDHIAEALAPDVMVPQVAQGALAVECRADDEATIALLCAVEHRSSRDAVDAERAFLAELGGGCDLPVGAHGVVGSDGEVQLTAVMASMDGTVVLRRQASGEDPLKVGRHLASDLLAVGGQRLLEGT